MAIRRPTSSTSPFHEGEQAVQEQLGVREEIEPWATKVVRPFLPQQHRDFYQALPFLVAAARDRAGRPWATLLVGEPGFAHSPQPSSLAVHARPAPGDALDGAFVEGADVGLLGLELHTRRRNRLNGRISPDASAGRPDAALTIEVEQAFGNCPQYIHARNWTRSLSQPRPIRHQHEGLTPSTRLWVEAADTFFIASGFRGEGNNPAFGMDASHRGGPPGFVRVENERTLVFPDYAGNNHFNTIGNLSMDPRAGLLFVDFQRGHLLQLTGTTTIDWKPEESSRFPGARRLVYFEIEEAVELLNAVPLRFDEGRDGTRELRVVDKVSESQDVTSFYFEPRGGGPLPGFVAGQYLPIEIDIPGQGSAVSRTYSLSNAPGGERYRITVKRESQGLASRHLHDSLAIDQTLVAATPRGEFLLDEASARPIALVGAGVGLTPLVSMLHSLADSSFATEGHLPIWFIHGVRDSQHHPLRDEIERIAAAAPGIEVHFAYSRPRPEDRLGTDYQSQGRIDMTLLSKLIPNLYAEFYLCGPSRFMASIQAGLEQRNVPNEHVHMESFGPVG